VRTIAAAALTLTLLLGAGLVAQNGPRQRRHGRELVVEPATLINLGFEWFIEGDANRNAA
jgi:hypothetical protein